MPTQHDPRIDDLRQRLRALGYLDAGVDRFVLGSARATQRPTTIAWLASLRIGALAAVLLGPAAALGLSARLPTLVTGPRDAFLIAIYLAVFFGVAVALSAFVVSLFVSMLSPPARGSGAALAARARLLSRTAGAIVTLACLVYLTLWWQTVIAGVGWSAPIWTASALAVAVAISLLLGHSVSVGASAVVLAGARNDATVSPPSAVSPHRSLVARWRPSVLVGLVAFAGAALLLTLSGRPSAAADAKPPALTVVSSGLRVRAIAIDGFDARIFEELSSAGRVPTLAAIFHGPVVRLDSGQNEPADPARIWTTVATGQPPHVHGVQGLETRRVTGVQGSVPAEEGSAVLRAIRGATDLVRLTRPSIASGSERRAKTFWEVAADAGLRTAVVNWWATWPATGDAGIVLSDRATLRLEHGGPLDAEIAPASLYELLRPRWPALKGRAVALAGEAMGSSVEATARDLLLRSAELDAMQLTLLAEVASTDTDLSVVYLPGLDIAQHTLLRGVRGDDTTDQRVAPSTLAQRLEAVKTYYVALDRLLGLTLASRANELLIVITEPGRVTTSTGARMALVGGAVRSAGTVDGATTDIAPTILHALGVPIARDLAGSPLTALFRPESLSRYPVRYVASYGPPMPANAARAGQPLDQEMIDRLRSLGYVR
jgi:Type I phosphodiesterase / nucleotide pyrophosphatase